MQLQGWYNRLQRDEVVAEWKKIKDKMSLHVHCHISGGHFLLDMFARLRFYIFCKELPVVIIYIAFPCIQFIYIFLVNHSHELITKKIGKKNILSGFEGFCTWRCELAEQLPRATRCIGLGIFPLQHPRIQQGGVLGSSERTCFSLHATGRFLRDSSCNQY